MDHSTHHGKIYIPDNEYLERVQKAAALLRQNGLDAMIVNGTESDYANPRYFSGYWPLFERAGVAISAGGDAALMCGPESRHFAADRSRLDKVFVLKEYREGADPSYPELVPDTFHDVFKAIGVTGQKLRIGVASFLDTSVTIYEGIRAAFPEAELVRADQIMTELRQIKSPAELACLREGYRIAELASQQVIREIRPGMTELQMVGVAERVVYEEGAEYYVTMRNLTPGSNRLVGRVYDEYGTVQEASSYNDNALWMNVESDGTPRFMMFDYLKPETIYYVMIEGGKAEYKISVSDEQF